MASTGLTDREIINGKGIADPRYREHYIAAHREDVNSAFYAGPAPRPTACDYKGPEGVLCGHPRTCGCHSWATSEKEAGIEDILAHDYVSPLAPRYLHFAPGDPDWLTSPTPTHQGWYEQGIEEGGGRP